MTWGSCEFFKKMIKAALLIVLPLCIIAVITLTITLILVAKNYEQQIEALEGKLNQLGPKDMKDQSGEINMTVQYKVAPKTAPTEISTNEEGMEKPSATIKDASLLFLPDFKHELPVFTAQDSRVAYLSFDDGPSGNTLKILDILDQYEIKATFFVLSKTGSKMTSALREISTRGHTIGMHSASHDRQEIYKSKEIFLTDMEANFQYIFENTGIYPQIFRFPGGSNNSKIEYYSTADEIKAEMTRRGFVYYDWNCAACDTDMPTPNASQILQNILKYARNKDKLIILAHDMDSKDETVEALPQIIEELQKRGYHFEPLTAEVKPITFG
jgi:peptidoglycan/xylan/chitin deacetylase (PgdA/CDA1 family)